MSRDFLTGINDALAILDRCVLDKETIMRLTRRVKDQTILAFCRQHPRLQRWHANNPRDDMIMVVRTSLAGCRINMHILSLLQKYLPSKTDFLPTSDFYRQTPWAEYYDRNNCYAYAIDDFSIMKRRKSVPGDENRSVNLRDCADMISRLQSALHSRHIKPVLGDPNDVNPLHPKRYMMRMDIAEDVDYHFYRDSNHRLVRVDLSDTNAYTKLSEQFKVPVEFIACVNSSVPREEGTSVLLCVPLIMAMFQKNGYAKGPRDRDACGKVMAVGTPICQNYGRDLNYKVACGYYTLDRQPIRVFRK